MQSRTPKNIDNVVMKFCRSIVQNASPVHLVIKPASKAILNECFQNVRSKIECVDGSMCLGWSIWICPRVWIEAEFHAVHRSALGDTLNDISPSETPSLTTRLFLPDPSATYDFATPKNRVENHRQALANDPLIARAFEFAKQENELISKIPGFGLVTVSGVVAKKLSDIKNERMSNIHQLIRRFKGPNNPCPCDSGLKLKKCHRNLV